MAKASLEIIYIISRHFVILWALVLPWICPQLRHLSIARFANPCVPTYHNLLCPAHFQSFLMSKDHLNCRWVWLSSSTNLETAS
jgi:hypothetical protein